MDFGGNNMVSLKYGYFFRCTIFLTVSGISPLSRRRIELMVPSLRHCSALTISHTSPDRNGIDHARGRPNGLGERAKQQKLRVMMAWEEGIQ